MPLKTEIPLCDCSVAVLDLVTLTYDVVEREPGGRARVRRRHVPSLRQARAYACPGAPSDRCDRRGRRQ
jgi:hypothetical protein